MRDSKGSDAELNLCLLFILQYRNEDLTQKEQA
jgi:hypothetical protein